MFAVDAAIPIWLPHFEQFVEPIVKAKQTAFVPSSHAAP